MLALADDAALARLMIAATAMPRRARSYWLREVAAKLDPRKQIAAASANAGSLR